MNPSRIELTGPALLFCPADRPERFSKAAKAADIVILDLEDGVTPAQRESARNALQAHPLDPVATIVRVNPIGTHDFDADLIALSGTTYDKVMLPKTESTDGLDLLEGRQLIALCETPRGVLAAAQIAADARVHALMWGAEDLVAAIGGTSSRRPDGSYLDVALAARGTVLLAAAAHSKPAIDAPWLALDDPMGLESEANDAATSGFAAKACIHPQHVPAITGAFQPTPNEIAWARALLALEDANGAAFRHQGRMIDEPILQQARHLMRRVKTAGISPTSCACPSGSRHGR